MSITSFDTTVLLGRTSGDLAIINISAPAAPGLISTFMGSASINDLITNLSHSLVFLSNSSSPSEFQVVNISTLASPTLQSSVNFLNGATGLAYSSNTDRIVLSSIENTQEVIIVQPF